MVRMGRNLGGASFPPPELTDTEGESGVLRVWLPVGPWRQNDAEPGLRPEWGSSRPCLTLVGGAISAPPTGKNREEMEKGQGGGLGQDRANFPPGCPSDLPLPW